MASAFRPTAARISAHSSLALKRTAFKPVFQRRFQSTVAEQAKEAAADGAKTAGKKGFAALWDSPVGPKTVHFWAPVMKWGLVLAGIADLSRPAEQLSLSQNTALLCTGAIWTRWCFVIRPKNYLLAAVNFFLFLTGTAQCVRILIWQQSQKDQSLAEELEGAVKSEAQSIKTIVSDPKAAIEGAKKD